MRHICRNVFVAVAAVKGANDMLMRGFTGARDVGGPARELEPGGSPESRDLHL
jgi:hypothetical protein